MKPTAKDITQFKSIVWKYYHASKRAMPWRENTSPYHVLVSEMMLQQTQVVRVLTKFDIFIELFPDFEQLANAPFSKVVKAWQGLGYNRRAQYLHKAAKLIVHAGWDLSFPTDPLKLESLPGIGYNTAAAITVYVHNLPIAFVETNIRSTHLHHFFPDMDSVDDKAVMQIVELTMDKDNPREWYWALMDYGSHLKKTRPNPNHRSKHYLRQSNFQGSTRQLRGKILKELTNESKSYENLKKIVSDTRFDAVLDKLEREQMVTRNGDTISIE